MKVPLLIPYTQYIKVSPVHLQIGFLITLDPTPLHQTCRSTFPRMRLCRACSCTALWMDVNRSHAHCFAHTACVRWTICIGKAAILCSTTASSLSCCCNVVQLQVFQASTAVTCMSCKQSECESVHWSYDQALGEKVYTSLVTHMTKQNCMPLACWLHNQIFVLLDFSTAVQR